MRREVLREVPRQLHRGPPQRHFEDLAPRLAPAITHTAASAQPTFTSDNTIQEPCRTVRMGRKVERWRRAEVRAGCARVVEHPSPRLQGGGQTVLPPGCHLPRTRPGYFGPTLLLQDERPCSAVPWTSTFSEPCSETERAHASATT